MTLTCWRCNNTDGSQLDKHLIERVLSFVALLKLDDDPLQVAGVVLPPPGSDGAPIYEAIRSEQGGPETMNPLAMPNGFAPLRETWEAVIARAN